jgi:hypothetical protein
MSEPLPKSQSKILPAAAFDPRQHTDSSPSWLGRRKESEKTPCILWQWPNENAGGKQRYDCFDAWHDLAMQILDNEGGSFRLMAVYKKVMQWKPGEIWSSDEELAGRAGRCSPRTISRDVAGHRRAGIILVENGWRKVHGKFLRSRTIRLAVPKTLGPSIILVDDPNHIATRGLSENPDHIATRGPDHIATRGLITNVTTEERGSRDDTA